MLNNFTAIKNFTLLGEVTFLMGVSALHKNYRVRDVHNNILPSIQLTQFRIYKIANQPVGFVSWAYLSDELAEKFCSEQTIIKLEDWHSCDNLFFMDFIAPFGHARLKQWLVPEVAIAIKKCFKLKKFTNFSKNRINYRTNSLEIKSTIQAGNLA